LNLLGFCFGFLFRYPYVTGTSIVAIKYKDGVLMASDMGGMSQLLVSALYLVKYLYWFNVCTNFCNVCLDLHLL